MTARSVFETLLALDVSKFVEKKGKFSYLSWSYAVAELRKHAPDAVWTVTKFPLPDAPHVAAPFCATPAGCFVEVNVTVAGVTLSQIHPVMDERNSTIKAPNAGDINKAIMRCLVKAIALHGLGLNVYAGEDLPLGDDGEPKAAKAPAAPTKAELLKAISAEYDRLGVGAGLSDEEKSKARSKDAAVIVGRRPDSLADLQTILGTLVEMPTTRRAA